MKEIAFRWIDKHLINVTIRENFLILFFAPLLAIIIVSATLIDAAEDQQNQILQQEMETVATLISQANLSQSDVSRILAGSNIQVGSNGKLTAQVADTGYTLTITEQPNLLSALTISHSVIIAAACLFIIMCLYYIMTFMGGALYNIYDAVTRLADGDLSYRINHSPARNDFNLIARTVDRVSEREHKLVIATQEAIALIQQISSELRQRSQDNEALTLQQQERIDSLASATEQMASSVREVASHAHDTSSQTNEATQLTTQGQTQVTTTLSAINQLGTEIKSASQAVEKLDSNTAQIGDVVTTISAISEQTNLLALNAAIEAARAGDLGRGFAVVADEVRTLAGNSQVSSNEIDNLVRTTVGKIEELASLIRRIDN